MSSCHKWFLCSSADWYSWAPSYLRAWLKCTEESHLLAFLLTFLLNKTLLVYVQLFVPLHVYFTYSRCRKWDSSLNKRERRLRLWESLEMSSHSIVLGQGRQCSSLVLPLQSVSSLRWASRFWGRDVSSTLSLCCSKMINCVTDGQEAVKSHHPAAPPVNWDEPNALAEIGNGGHRKQSSQLSLRELVVWQNDQESRQGYVEAYGWPAGSRQGCTVIMGAVRTRKT